MPNAFTFGGAFLGGSYTHTSNRDEQRRKNSDAVRDGAYLIFMDVDRSQSVQPQLAETAYARGLLGSLHGLRENAKIALGAVGRVSATTASNPSGPSLYDVVGAYLDDILAFLDTWNLPLQEWETQFAAGAHRSPLSSEEKDWPRRPEFLRAFTELQPTLLRHMRALAKITGVGEFMDVVDGKAQLLGLGQTRRVEPARATVTTSAVALKSSVTARTDRREFFELMRPGHGARRA